MYLGLPVQVAVPPELSIMLQTLVKSIRSLPIGPGAPILFPPNAGSLKYTSSAVASICALSIVFIAAPPALRKKGLAWRQWRPAPRRTSRATEYSNAAQCLIRAASVPNWNLLPTRHAVNPAKVVTWLQLLL